MVIALSSVGCPLISPCLGNMNHYLLGSLWDHFVREEVDQLNEIWSSYRQFRELSRKWWRLLPALMVFTMASSSLAETWKACSKQFLLTRENSVCQNVQIQYITTLHLGIFFLPKCTVLLLRSILHTRKSHRGIFLIIWEQTHQSICQGVWPT